jgi:hypothetical protein
MWLEDLKEFVIPAAEGIIIVCFAVVVVRGTIYVLFGV